MATIDTFLKDFPVLSQYTYANTAASGLLSESLMEWRQGHDIDFLIGGSKFRESVNEQIEAVRKGVADFFDAEKTQTVLTPNFSFALKTFVSGLELSKKILLLEDDYPSLNWPFESAGFKDVSTIKLTENLEQSIESAFSDAQPDVFAFSIVQYVNGIKIDLEFINRLKEKYPKTIFVADATQYGGTESFSFKNSGIDVFGGSGYKWMLAGYGNGYMLIKDDVAKMLYTESLKFQPRKEDFLQHKNHITSHFEPGHHDTLNFGSLLFAIDQFTEIGVSEITAHLHELSEYAKEKFSALNLLSPMVVNRKQHSTIFNLSVSAKMIEALKARGIVFSLRGDGVRVSFHLYNTKKDIDKIANILKHS
ncbi:aminotransferase class V-fold PLP-dependent enzyme [Joostella sp. CR20]|uniref:aminotransferase class V-fold PLP-dependent enzyme n=1 Tax=Joostella sp. CR20 TaxID=2804312 RepID=UPI00313E5259